MPVSLPGQCCPAELLHLEFILTKLAIPTMYVRFQSILSMGFMVAVIFSVQVHAQPADGLHPKLQFRKWSGDLNVPDPVAVSVDNQGRVYATQTRRRKVQDLDIRQHRQWIPDDVGLRTVREKQAFFKSVLAIGGDQDKQREEVGDFNEDGQHDWRDLTVISEVVYRVVDSDQDGTADEVKVFAEDFKTEVTGIAAGVMAFDDDVYLTVAPDLWKLGDDDEDGIADRRVSLAHGFGIHIAYGGHDMHGLTMGPDGKIYWSIGDKGINVTTQDGQKFEYPHRGGVMRCNPDGSEFEVFAHGLRNVQELAFDQFGNLFGIDNDADQTGERERFVYIVNQMDAGWRNYYQYRGDAYNPWTDERLWQLPEENHPAYIVPPLSHSIDGPAGFKFNPGTALSPSYKDYFFLTGAPNGNQFAFRVQVDGDAFKMVDFHQIGSGIAIVGLAFGPDGALYGADWDGGYPLDEKGGIIRIDVDNAQDLDARCEVRQLLAEGFAGRSAVELVLLLGHADRRIRLAAQFQLVRSSAGGHLAAVARDENASRLARLHALWGLGQLGRRGESLARDTLVLLFKSEDPILRGQAAKTYGELKAANGRPLLRLIEDENPQVRTLAALALARLPTEKAVDLLWKQTEQLRKNGDHYLRHGLTMALAACAEAAQLVEKKSSAVEATRLCAVLALRRKMRPEAAEFLADSSAWVADAAARAIHDEKSIPESLPKLAEALLVREDQSKAFFRRAVNANFRLGDAESAGRLFQFAKQAERPEAYRAHALEALARWNQNGDGLDHVEGIRRDPSGQVREYSPGMLDEGLAELVLEESASIRSQAIAVAQSVGFELPEYVLKELALNESLDDETRVLAIESLNQQVRRVLETMAKSKSVLVRTRAVQLLAGQDSSTFHKRVANVLKSDPSAQVKQSAIGMLAARADESAVEQLTRLGQALLKKELEPELGLDVLEALQACSPRWEKASKLVEQIQQIDDGSALPARYRYSRDGGSVELGEKLFRTHVQAQCSRCHKVGSDGSTIGPDLTEIASKRDPDYLLRAVALPSADIEEKYRNQVLLLESGKIVKGVVQSETAEETIVADATGQLQTIATDEVEHRSVQKVSLMPDLSDVLTAGEVRDLVAYLRTLKSPEK